MSTVRIMWSRYEPNWDFVEKPLRAPVNSSRVRGADPLAGCHRAAGSIAEIRTHFLGSIVVAGLKPQFSHGALEQFAEPTSSGSSSLRARRNRAVRSQALNDSAPIPEQIHRRGTDEIEVPTLLYMGASTELYDPEAVAERAHRLMPDVETVIVPDARHGLPFQQPELTIKTILGSCDRGRGQMSDTDREATLQSVVVGDGLLDSRAQPNEADTVSDNPRPSPAEDLRGDGSTSPRWLARQPVWWAALAMGVASVIALTAPASTQPVRRVAIAAMLFAGALLVMAVLDRSWQLALGGLLFGVVGGLLIDETQSAVRAATWIVLVAVVLVGIATAQWLRTQLQLSTLLALSTGLIVASLGPLFVVYDQQMLPMGLGLLGLLMTLAVATGLVLIGRRNHPARVRMSLALREVASWTDDRMRIGDPDADDVVTKLMLDGPIPWQRVYRFFALMALASTIASFGVLADSTAVVIGAMLIAPLMQPLMASSLALVEGWTERLGRSLSLVAGGAMIAIVAGVFTTAVIGQGTDPATNTQIVTRASPNLLDLAIAVAAGAAGAFATSRRDVSDSLPGVAVAIALVPPLAVVGVTLQLGDASSALGALLLFTTNAVAIIAMGAMTFVGTGVAGVQTRSRRPVGAWVVAIAGAGAAVLWLLVANSSSAAEEGARESITQGLVDQWIDDRDYTIEEVEIDGSNLRIVLVGPETPDDTDALLSELDAVLEGDITLDLRITLQERVPFDD